MLGAHLFTVFLFILAAEFFLNHVTKSQGSKSPEC